MSFCKAKPSDRYRQLLAEYQRLHGEGDRRLGLAPEETFEGHSLLPHVENIAVMCRRHHAVTLLDYGAGKGMQYKIACVTVEGRDKQFTIPVHWGIRYLTCYDPAYPPFAQLPAGRTFDGVICTDVLEHCPAEDLPWIIAELFELAGNFVYAGVASFPAMKHLANGENAHCTIRPDAWWRELIRSAAAKNPEVDYFFAFHHADDTAARGQYHWTTMLGRGLEDVVRGETFGKVPQLLVMANSSGAPGCMPASARGFRQRQSET